MRVIDKGGEWVVNRGEFRLPLYDRPGMFLEPGQETKVEITDFIKGQPSIEKIEDPMGEPAPKKK